MINRIWLGGCSGIALSAGGTAGGKPAGAGTAGAAGCACAESMR